VADTLNIKTILKKHGLRPKKSWSQNFLVDLSVLARIVDAAELDSDDVVVELGAGLGALTAMLAKDAGKVIAVERDRDLAKVLMSEFAADNKVEILEADAVRLNWNELLARMEKPPVVVGNLPYHIASQIIFSLLDVGTGLNRWLVMVQREMAVRMVAGPGGKDYGVMSIHLQMHADVETILDVPPEAFIPSPRVQSRVVKCRPLDAPRVSVKDMKLFRRVVRAVFSQRRKQIRNSLRANFGGILSDTLLDEALVQAEIQPTMRPEQLKLEEFGALSDALLARLEHGRGWRHQ